jgi:hypothetical protein
MVAIVAIAIAVGVFVTAVQPRVVQIIVTFSHPTNVAVSWIVGEQRGDDVARSSPFGTHLVASDKDTIIVVAQPVKSTNPTNNTVVQIKVDGHVRKTCPGVGAQGVSCQTKV